MSTADDEQEVDVQMQGEEDDTDVVAAAEDDDGADFYCDVCGDGTWDEGNWLLLCDKPGCDGAYHTVESRYDGVYRYIVFDGVVRASVVAVGTHANRDDNLCLGADNDNGTPFTGTLRNFR